MDDEDQAIKLTEIEKTDSSSIAKKFTDHGSTCNSPQRTWDPSSVHAR